MHWGKLKKFKSQNLTLGTYDLWIFIKKNDSKIRNFKFPKMNF